jgi:hypothetical protein
MPKMNLKDSNKKLMIKKNKFSLEIILKIVQFVLLLLKKRNVKKKNKYINQIKTKKLKNSFFKILKFFLFFKTKI